MSTYGMWLSASGMRINEYKQTLHANNMANAHTTGFKHDMALVTQRKVESQESGSSLTHPVLDGMSGGANVRPTFQNFSQGPIERTGGALDVAIDGDGFFSVSDGQVTRYTRDGEFAVNRGGELVMASGEGRWRVLAEGGSPIVVDETAGPLVIGQDGTIKQGDEVLAKLEVVTTRDKQALIKSGRNLFDAGDAEMELIDPRLRPESRERSNFDVVQGLASMIEATRAYEMNARLLQMQDALAGQAVSALGRLA